jgi:hypothetical protein
MNRDFFKRAGLNLAVLGLAGGLLLAPAAEAKRTYTITNRITTLTSKVNAGQKSGELTLKEADNLRDKLADVNSRISKFQAKNGGKLSYADENKIEKDLNDVSLKLSKKELAKRVNKP